MAAAASTAHAHRPWPPLLSATTPSRSTTARPAASPLPLARVRSIGGGASPRSSWAWRRRPRVAAAGSGAAEEAVSYSSSISTDMPLYEPPGVSFDEYLLDRARVFRAMFPDESRSQRLSDEEWRIEMLPLRFLLITVHPVVVMQLRPRAGGALDLRITEWELRGLDSGYTPASFDLGVRGSLYADRSRSRRASRLRGHLEIAVACALPPPLRLVPEGILRGVAESVLSSLAEKMKRDVDVGLVADFQRFRREKAAAAAGKVNAKADTQV